MATETEVGERLRRRGWRTEFTVAEMVDAWAVLVSAIERGYCGCSKSWTTPPIRLAGWACRLA
ncbi:hypothetical protein [Streptomyces collinus]|uniref:hypothetical protein n=1 Tax=Streptomyces collinus TaxID=42684 RepID=UPI0033C3BF0F